MVANNENDPLIKQKPQQFYGLNTVNDDISIKNGARHDDQSMSSSLEKIVGTTTFDEDLFAETSYTGPTLLHDSLKRSLSVNDIQSNSLTNLSNTATTIDRIKNIRQSVIQKLRFLSWQSTDGEELRKFRRTIYSHDDWRMHRTSNRFIYHIVSFHTSNVYKNIMFEVTCTTFMAILTCLWNGLCTGFTDFHGIKHPALFPIYFVPLSLPMAPFTLTSSSLGLLLVFRTNATYQRWDEARKVWGMNINHACDLLRLGNVMYDHTDVPPDRCHSDLHALALCVWAFSRAMKRHLSPADEDEDDFQLEVYEKLPFEQATTLISSFHRPNRALHDLSVAVENLPMHFMRKNEIHKAVTIFEDNLGAAERLLTSPIPLFYSRHTSRFLAFWLLLLPLALYNMFPAWNHLSMIPATIVISVFLFSIEEKATQLEEPFSILPMQAFCDKIFNYCNEIAAFGRCDRGMILHEHTGTHSQHGFGSSLYQEAR